MPKQTINKRNMPFSLIPRRDFDGKIASENFIDFSFDRFLMFEIEIGFQ